MTAAKYDVLGIGNAIFDILVRTDDNFLAQQGMTKGSMALIDEARAASIYAAMGPATEMSGGSAANTIVGIASFGAKAAYVGKVKDDQIGRLYSHDIRATGVAFETAAASSGPATGCSYILVTPDGERTMNTFLGACVNLGPADIDPAVVADAQVTYMEGYLWDKPLAKEAFILAAELAHGAGRKTALTLSDSFCVDRHRDSFLDLIRNGIDILFANEKEIMSLYQTERFPEALKAARQDCDIAVLTRSEAGCVVARKDEMHTVPSHYVREVVDATGAGDLFSAGFLYGYTNGKGLVESARLGALAAAEVISHIGARPEVNLRDHARKNGLL